MIRVTIKPPLRDKRGRFQRMETETLAIARRETQAMGRMLRDAVREAVPGSGGLARHVHFRTYAAMTRVVLEIYGDPKEPYPKAVFDYIRKGTRPHIIAARRARVLAFFWDKIGAMAFFQHEIGRASCRERV